MRISMKGSGSVTVDGRTFNGRNIQISGDKVIVDGVEQDGSLVGPISIQVNGDVERLESSSGSVTVQGGAGSVKTTSGDVRCGDVQGSVNTMSGDVNSGKISGNVSTMSGDVTSR